MGEWIWITRPVSGHCLITGLPEGEGFGLHLADEAGRLGPFRPGAALIALRLDAPIVPFAMAGTEELYVGRRMASRRMSPVPT